MNLWLVIGILAFWVAYMLLCAEAFSSELNSPKYSKNSNHAAYMRSKESTA